MFRAQVYAMPVFDMMESLLVKKMNFSPGLRLRLISRTLYVGNVPLNFSQLNSSVRHLTICTDNPTIQSVQRSRCSWVSPSRSSVASLGSLEGSPLRRRPIL
jgi:hypothetical protein